jgi:hypothetical protein
MKNETNDSKFSNYILTLNKYTDEGHIKANIVVDGLEGHLTYEGKECYYTTFYKIRANKSKSEAKIIIDDAINFISKKFEFDIIDKQTFVYIVTLSNTMDLDILLANVHVTHFLKKYHFEIQWLMF